MTTEPAQSQVPLGEAEGATRSLLIGLAEHYVAVDDHRRPCCDSETTLQDWYDALGAAEVEQFKAAHDGT